MSLELFDSHVHLDAQDYDTDRDQVIERAREAGVTRFVTIGAGLGLESADRALALAEKYEFIWASVGVQPHDAGSATGIERLRELAGHPKVVAIGETGLDYYRNLAPVADQRKWFKAQIELALECKKPLIIHSREAGADCYDLLCAGRAKDVGGVFHCYSEDRKFAENLRDINFLVSVPGSITFKKADAFRETMKNIPLEQIMLETDGPFLAPEPYRGKRCESAYMLETARVLAKLKGISLEELAARTSANACRFFGITTA